MTAAPARTGRATPARGPADVDPLDALVGREQELRAIGALIAGLGDGRGGTVIVSGEPGIGKTRLLRAAGSLAAEHGFAVSWGHVWAQVGAPPLWPWVQVLRTITADVTDLADLAGIETVLARPGAAYVAALVPELGPLLAGRGDGSVEHADFYLRDAAVTLLVAAARQRPRVILLDDLHLADAASLHLAEHLARASRGAPVCLIGSVRDEAATHDHSAVLARLRAGCLDLPLGGLGPDQCRELARARFDRSLSDTEGRAVYERTGGNPLLCEEVLVGAVDRPGSTVSPAGSVLRERLARLGPAEHGLLEIASLAGPVFSTELIARVAGVDPADAASSVAALVAAGLVQHHQDGTLVFRHALVAETACAGLDPARRAELHRAWADTLVEAWPPAADHPAVVAEHLLAGRPLSDGAEARRWATRAALTAADRLAPDDAAHWYEQGLRAVDPCGDDDVERCDLLLALGRARLQGTAIDRATEALEEAAGAAQRAGDSARRLDALVWLTEARYRAPGVQLDEAARVTLAAAIDATSTPPPRLAARAAEQLARVETLRGTSERALAVARGALAAARRSGDAEAMSAAQRALRWALVGPFGIEEKRQASHLLADALGRHSHPADWWNARSWMLLDALEAGDRPLIDAELQSCRRLADRLREPFLSAQTVAWETAVALLEGRYDEAERMITRGLDAADGAGVNTGGLYAQLGCLAWDRGEHATLVDLVRGVAEAVPERSALYRAVLAGIHADQGRRDEANFELDRLAVDGFAHVPRDGDWLTALAWCATACTRLDRAELAAGLRALLMPFRDRAIVAGGRPFLFCGSVTYYTGMLAVTAGDPDAAVDDLAAALAFHRRLGARPWVAYTLCEQGRAWLARGAGGDARRAAAAFEAAGNEAGALGMAALVTRAADLARQRPAAHPTLMPQGAGWRVGFSGAPLHLDDSKGLRCLHHLLGRPGVPVPAAELVAGVLGGPVPDPERARVNITRQLRAAVERIGEHDRDLHDHLRAALVTGRECAYRPAGAPPRWRLG